MFEGRPFMAGLLHFQKGQSRSPSAMQSLPQIEVATETEMAEWMFWRTSCHAPDYGIQFNFVDVSGMSDRPALVRSGVISCVFKSITNTSPLVSMATLLQMT